MRLGSHTWLLQFRLPYFALPFTNLRQAPFQSIRYRTSIWNASNFRFANLHKQLEAAGKRSVISPLCWQPCRAAANGLWGGGWGGGGGGGGGGVGGGGGGGGVLLKLCAMTL